MSLPYTSYQIEPGFWCIEECGVRCFLFEGDDEALLIDAGFGTGDLKDYISTLTVAPVKRLVITHADRDHIGCAYQFDQILMHPAEFERYAASGKNSAKLFSLWENSELSIGQWNLSVILLPGHTPGSIALLEREHKFLIAGDCVQATPIYMFGQGRNLPAFIHSIDRLTALSSSFDTIYASHGKLVLSTEILPLLKEGAQQVLSGNLVGNPLPREMPCLHYQWDQVGFLYDN